jgi:hypothetical protein
MKTEPAEPLLSEPPDFSLILGGPLFQLLRRAHLCGDVAELVWRRVIALALITWLPLLVLSIAEGHAWGDSVKVPFLLDVDVHARFLLALPLFIVAELVVHQRMRLVVGTFVKRGLLPDKARERFHAAIAAAMRLRNSVLAEVLLIAIRRANDSAFTVCSSSPRRGAPATNRPWAECGHQRIHQVRFAGDITRAGNSGDEVLGRLHAVASFREFVA